MGTNIPNRRSESSDDAAAAACADWQPILTLLAADELDRPDEARVAAHLAACPGCTAALLRERQLVALFAERGREPNVALLANCRTNLADALDREEDRGWIRRTLGLRLPTSWLSPGPAWSAAVLLIIGFAVGFLGPRLLQRPQVVLAPVRPAAISPGATSSVTGSAANNVIAQQNVPNTDATPPHAPLPSEPAGRSSAPIDLRPADVAAIRVLPSGEDAMPRVRLQLQSRQPVMLQGPVDEDDVKGALLDIVRHAGTYPDEARLDAVSLLRACNSDPEVRAVLCRAAHTDRSPAIRLKALEALSGSDPQDIIQQTLLDALAADENADVRLQAVSALRDMAAHGQIASDSHTLTVLRDREAKDPNASVRLQSAAVLRDLAPIPSGNMP